MKYPKIIGTVIVKQTEADTTNIDEVFPLTNTDNK